MWVMNRIRNRNVFRGESDVFVDNDFMGGRVIDVIGCGWEFFFSFWVWVSLGLLSFFKIGICVVKEIRFC